MFLDHKDKGPREIERPAGYSQRDFRDELFRQICDFDEYGDRPVHTSGRQRALPSLVSAKPAASYIFKSLLRTINCEISGMVIDGNIIRHKGISVARTIWFVCSKLLKICFFNPRFVKE